jgi:hypothetical protein
MRQGNSGNGSLGVTSASEPGNIAAPSAQPALFGQPVQGNNSQNLAEESGNLAREETREPTIRKELLGSSGIFACTDG